MALNDVGESDGGNASRTRRQVNYQNRLAPSESAAAPTTRIGQVVSEFTTGHLLDDLRQKHDVTVWRFDQHLSRVAMLPKRADTAIAAQDDEAAQAAGKTRIE